MRVMATRMRHVVRVKASSYCSSSAPQQYKVSRYQGSAAARVMFAWDIVHAAVRVSAGVGSDVSICVNLRAGRRSLGVARRSCPVVTSSFTQS